MNAPRELIHPRKLYSRLREAPSAAERAKSVLGFLCSATGAAGGYLFLLRDETLALACSTLDGGDSPELRAEVMRAWNQDLDRLPENNQTMTMDGGSIDLSRQVSTYAPWRNAQNDVFERRLLCVYRYARWTPVGIAMLKSEGGHELAPVRPSHIEALCGALLDAGDVSEPAPTEATSR